MTKSRDCQSQGTRLALGRGRLMADLFGPATVADISTAQKIEALERELKFRRVVYARLVAKGTISEGMKDRQILILEAILADYRGK